MSISPVLPAGTEAMKAKVTVPPVASPECMAEATSEGGKKAETKETSGGKSTVAVAPSQEGMDTRSQE
jgi:hypothetical protein